MRIFENRLVRNRDSEFVMSLKDMRFSRHNLFPLPLLPRYFSLLLIYWLSFLRTFLAFIFLINETEKDVMRSYSHKFVSPLSKHPWYFEIDIIYY